MKGYGKQEIPQKTCQPMVLSGMIPTYENPGVTQPEIELGSPCKNTFLFVPDSSCMLRLLCGALLLNPDVSTFWSMRRDIVLADSQQEHSELHFTAVLLSRKPKCSEVFAHRRWLLGRLLQGHVSAEDLLREELRLSQYAADRYPNNYYAWSHRMWCINQFTPSIAAPVKVLWEEWDASRLWVLRHVSDHSGLQYRQFLLKKLSAQLAASDDNCEQSARNSVILQFLCVPSHGEGDSSEQNDGNAKSFTDLLLSDILFNTELILRFTGHEALWYHRRFLLYVLSTSGVNSKLPLSPLSPPNCHMSIDGIPLEKDLKLADCKSPDGKNTDGFWQVPLTAYEQTLVSKCLPEDANQFRLAGQHCRWLSRIMHLLVSQYE
ncbi:hypothetical protein PR048_021359 [Dryococelus australis]|uniref:Protein prenyltransferase alpha subunit repeat-containing protein 1 n=1 Tax=Dryococelus australis TaxID=614101 RepID=A0ABQ9GY19_9NEOP|nr:hypothetical protein PR048_021359 [Dryococelus australis]